MKIKSLIFFSLFVVIAFLFSNVFCFETGFATKRTEEEKETIVADVNGHKISKFQLEMVAERYRKNAKKKELNKEEKNTIVKSIIHRELILSLPEVQKYRTNPAIIRQVRKFEDSLISRKYIEIKIGSLLKVTEEMMKKYYKENQQKFAFSARVNASHILLRSEKDAKMVLDKLKKGEKFKKLAKQYSIDLPMALKGGGMGIIEKGQSHPALEKVLFILEEGDISEIVKTRFGYHILTVNNIQPKGIKPFVQVKKDISKILIRDKESILFSQMAAELEKKADITIFDENI